MRCVCATRPDNVRTSGYCRTVAAAVTRREASGLPQSGRPGRIYAAGWRLARVCAFAPNCRQVQTWIVSVECPAAESARTNVYLCTRVTTKSATVLRISRRDRPRRRVPKALGVSSPIHRRKQNLTKNRNCQVLPGIGRSNMFPSFYVDTRTISARQSGTFSVRRRSLGFFDIAVADPLAAAYVKNACVVSRSIDLLSRSHRDE